MIPDFLRQLRSQQGGVLLDTNVLLLHLISRTDSTYAPSWKRTLAFTREHIALVELAVREAKKLVTTPHILTEVTNLSNGLPNHLRQRYASELRHFIARARERSTIAKLAAADPAFDYLGLADVVPTFFARGRPLIVTVDGPLTTLLEQRKLPHVNLHHLVFPVRSSLS